MSAGKRLASLHPQAMARWIKMFQATDRSSVTSPVCAQSAENSDVAKEKEVVVRTGAETDAVVPEKPPVAAAKNNGDVFDFVEANDSGYASDEIRRKRAELVRRKQAAVVVESPNQSRKRSAQVLGRPRRQTKKPNRWTIHRKNREREGNAAESIESDDEDDIESDAEARSEENRARRIADEDEEFVALDDEEVSVGSDSDDSVSGENDDDDDEGESAEKEEESQELSEKAPSVLDVDVSESEKPWHSCQSLGVSKADFIAHLGRLPTNKTECKRVATLIHAAQRNNRNSDGAAQSEEAEKSAGIDGDENGVEDQNRSARPKRKTRTESVITDYAKIVQLFLDDGNVKPFEVLMDRKVFKNAALANYGNRNSDNHAIQEIEYGDAARFGVFRLSDEDSVAVRTQCFLCKAKKDCCREMISTLDGAIIGVVGRCCAARFEVLLYAGEVYRFAIQYRATLLSKRQDETDWEVDRLLTGLKNLYKRIKEVLA